MKEIGGYLEFETFLGKSYHQEAMAFNSGRNAICFLVLSKKYKRVWVPTYLCDSIQKALKKYTDIEILYYEIGIDFKPLYHINMQPSDCILIVNFYGQLLNSDILQYKKQYPNLILDNTQSYFQYPVDNVDTVYSCRKYFGVPDGAYLYMNGSKQDYKFLKKDISGRRLRHLIGRFETKASSYYANFLENEFLIDELPIMKMSDFTSNLLRGFSYQIMIRRRTENFNYLHSALQKMNELSIQNNAGLFQYPLMVKYAEKLRNYLISNKIYIPILWKSVLNSNNENSISGYLAKHILPLPIDHRYGEQEMKQIIERIMIFVENKV